MNIIYNLPNRKSLMLTFDISWSNTTKIKFVLGYFWYVSLNVFENCGSYKLQHCYMRNNFISLLVVGDEEVIDFIYIAYLCFIVMNSASFALMKPCIVSSCKKKKKYMFIYYYCYLYIKYQLKIYFISNIVFIRNKLNYLFVNY